MPVTWVVGASGLLGRHTVALARHRQHQLVHTPVPWQEDKQAVLDALCRGTEQLLRAAGGDGRWNLVWVAGAGVVGTSGEALLLEREVYDAFLSQLADQLVGRGRSNASLFVASSAGGLYAGSSGAPFTEASEVRPLAPYGFNKLAMEESTRAFTAATGVPVMIGRISNLYGPGQNVAKAQGLITQLAKGYLLRQPVLLYVSLDTIRDYLYVGDCARMIVRAVELMLPAQRAASKAQRAAGKDVRRGPDLPTPEPGLAVVKILASGRGTSIAELVGTFQRLFKRRVPLVLGDSPNRKFQVRDLRMRSQVWTKLDQNALTTLPAGIGATIADLSARIRTGELRAIR
jgi:UDP-glucose 4-epimerase